MDPQQIIVLAITLILVVISFSLLCILLKKYNILTQKNKKLESKVNALSEKEQKLTKLLKTTQKNLLDYENATILQNKQDAWCSTALLPLPTDAPKDLHDYTLHFTEFLLKKPKTPSLYELRQQNNFVNPGAWELYWCLANAAHAAAPYFEIKVEDSITNEFIQALKENVNKLSSIIDKGRPLLEIAYCTIYDGAAPSLKEIDVGADLLLVIGGNGLIDGGGGRLLWIQAKKTAKNDGAYMLDCSHTNSRGLQLDALRKLDVPQKGSMALYILYSSSLNFIPAIRPISHSPEPEKKKIDLSKYGVRFQELATTFLSCHTKDVGKFATSADVINFIKSAGNNKPLHVVSITEDPSRHWIAKDLVNEIALYYREALGLSYPHEHSQDLEIEKNNDLDLDMW